MPVRCQVRQSGGVFNGMDTFYVIVTVLAAVAYGWAGTLNFVRAESVKVVARRVRVSEKWMIPLGILLACGAVGLLIGLAIPPLGIVAASGLVVYFICALGAHLRVHDRGVGGAIFFLVLALGVLAVRILARSHE